MTVAKFALATALALSAGLALADPPPQGSGWTYAQWGMTHDQLRAASGGKAHAFGNADDLDELDDPYVIGTMRFLVTFGYKNGALAQVSLDIAPDPSGRNHCDPVKAYLAKTYGKPALDLAGKWPVMGWRDAATGDTVMLETYGDGAAVCHYVIGPASMLAEYEAQAEDDKDGE